MEGLPKRESVLKKLLIKICLRAEVERFRLDPTCWHDRTANPLLHRTLMALRSCPLLRDAAIGDNLFQQLLSTLPQLATQMKAIDGKDLLVTLANDLGNMWTLVLLTEQELHGKGLPDMTLLDDLQPEDHDGDATYMAGARALREQSMRSFVAALLDMNDASFLQVYQDTIHAPSMEDIPKESVKTALVHAFDAMDYMITHAVLADPVRRKEFKHKARQMSSPLVGPLLNAANPFRYLPTFVRLALRTGLAEKLALRSAQQKLQESQRGLSPLVCRMITQNVESGRFNIPVAQIKMEHLESIGFSPFQDQGETILQTLKYSTLVWQNRQFMQLCKRKELAFLLEEIIPRIGTPLAALWEELRIGDEIAGLGQILQNVARRQEGSLVHLRMRLFTYITTTLRHEGSHKLQENLFWLYEHVSKPQIISLHFVSSGSRGASGNGCAQVGGEDAPLLWEEVENARASLARGEHFHNLHLPLTRQVAHHFHLQLVEERSK